MLKCVVCFDVVSDPEELKRIQETQRNQPSPLANLLQGRT